MDTENQQLNTPALNKKERRELKQQEKIMEQQGREKRKLVRRIALWLFVVLFIGGTIFGITKFVTQTPASDDLTASLSGSVKDSDWIKGNKESEILLVEYSDFQCPACASYSSLVRKLTSEFGNEIKFVYRHFPLKQIHSNAELAARASEAAGRQGKFWEMHDMIFENQKEWSNERNPKDSFIGYAEQLGLDKYKFEKDLESQEVKDAVQEDLDSGLKARVNATPTFFLNGAKIKNPRSYDEFRQVIIQVLGQNSG